MVYHRGEKATAHRGSSARAHHESASLCTLVHAPLRADIRNDRSYARRSSVGKFWDTTRLFQTR